MTTLLEWLEEITPPAKEGEDQDTRMWAINQYRQYHHKEVVIFRYAETEGFDNPIDSSGFWMDPTTYEPYVYIWEIPEGVIEKVK